MILLLNVYIKLEEEKICVKRYTKIVRVGGMPWPKTDTILIVQSKSWLSVGG